LRPRGLCHCEPLKGRRGNLLSVIARLPFGNPWQSQGVSLSLNNDQNLPLNNLREILDSLKKEGGFVIARAPYGSPWQSQMRLASPTRFSYPKGWIMRLFRRFAPRNLFFNGMYHNPSQNRRLPRLNTFGVQARNDKSIGCFVLRSSQ